MSPAEWRRLADENAELRDENAELRRRIAELEKPQRRPISFGRIER